MPIRRSSPHHGFRARPPFAVAGQTIGLLGGSFNPAHEAHLLVSDIARRSLGLDRVWWIVSPGNPLKDKTELMPLATRLSFARQIAARPWIEITAFEQALGSPFTVDSLAYLQRRYPGVRFVWLMGADNLATVHRWRRWRQIFMSVPVAVVDRPRWHLRASASVAARTFARARLPEQRAATLVRMRAPAWTLLTGPLSAQSSTAIRAARKKRSS